MPYIAVADDFSHEQYSCVATERTHHIGRWHLLAGAPMPSIQPSQQAATCDRQTVQDCQLMYQCEIKRAPFVSLYFLIVEVSSDCSLIISLNQFVAHFTRILSTTDLVTTFYYSSSIPAKMSEIAIIWPLISIKAAIAYRKFHASIQCSLSGPTSQSQRSREPCPVPN